MKKSLFLISALIFLCSFSFLNGQESCLSQTVTARDERPAPKRPSGKRRNLPGKELTPYSVKSLTSGSTKLEVRTDVSGASVYINGNYKGTTPLSVNSLKPGNYELWIEKSGYEGELFRINLSKGMLKTYKIQLHRLTGYIRFEDLPSDAMVYIDGSYSLLKTATLSEGNHRIMVKRFGYEDAAASVYVNPHETTTIRCSFAPAPLRLSGFSCNKKKFNPESCSTLNSCTFTANVNADGNGILKISDETGTVVFTENFSSFSTWNISCQWNGKDENGNRLPSGKYSAVFEAGGSSLSSEVYIDYSIRQILADITPFGSGTGTLLSARAMTADTITLGASIGPDFRTDTGISSVPLEFDFSWAITDWFEISNIFRCHLGQKEVPLQFCGSAKFAGSTKISEQAKFDYAGSLFFGFCDKPLYEPCGANCGTGLGISAAAGFETKHIYTGAASQFLLAPDSTAVSETHFTWQNGLSISFMPFSDMGFDLYGSLNSFFKPEEADWLNSIQGGLTFSVMIPSTSWKISVSGQTIYYFAINAAYINCRLGMAVLL